MGTRVAQRRAARIVSVGEGEQQIIPVRCVEQFQKSVNFLVRTFFSCFNCILSNVVAEDKLGVVGVHHCKNTAISAKGERNPSEE